MLQLSPLTCQRSLLTLLKLQPSLVELLEVLLPGVPLVPLVEMVHHPLMARMVPHLLAVKVLLHLLVKVLPHLLHLTPTVLLPPLHLTPTALLPPPTVRQMAPVPHLDPNRLEAEVEMVLWASPLTRLAPDSSQPPLLPSSVFKPFLFAMSAPLIRCSNNRHGVAGHVHQPYGRTIF